MKIVNICGMEHNPTSMLARARANLKATNPVAAETIWQYIIAADLEGRTISYDEAIDLLDACGIAYLGHVECLDGLLAPSEIADIDPRTVYTCEFRSTVQMNANFRVRLAGAAIPEFTHDMESSGWWELIGWGYAPR